MNIYSTIAQTLTIVKKPICPTFVHDDITRTLISVTGLIICGYFYYKMFRYINNDFR
jgi:hypothetical protein